MPKIDLYADIANQLEIFLKSKSSFLQPAGTAKELSDRERTLCKGIIEEAKMADKYMRNIELDKRHQGTLKSLTHSCITTANALHEMKGNKELINLLDQLRENIAQLLDPMGKQASVK